MKKLQFKRLNDPKKKMKLVRITSRTEDNECITHVLKKFTYKVSVSEEKEPKTVAPEVFIKKSFNTRRRVEKFNFLVKGHFFVKQKRMLLKVDFQHTLNIHISWKHKAFSPKKSEALT